MTELRLIKNFYPGGSSLVYSVHGAKHPKYGTANAGYVWVQALTGDLAGAWFTRLVVPGSIPNDAASPGGHDACNYSLERAELYHVMEAWSMSQPKGYAMKNDMVL